MRPWRLTHHIHAAHATCEMHALRLARLPCCIGFYERDHVRGTFRRKTDCHCQSSAVLMDRGKDKRSRYSNPISPKRIFANSDLLPLISNTICTLAAQCAYLAQASELSLARPAQPHTLSRDSRGSSLLISQLCLRPSGGETLSSFSYFVQDAGTARDTEDTFPPRHTCPRLELIGSSGRLCIAAVPLTPQDESVYSSPRAAKSTPSRALSRPANIRLYHPPGGQSVCVFGA